MAFLVLSRTPTLFDGNMHIALRTYQFQICACIDKHEFSFEFERYGIISFLIISNLQQKLDLIDSRNEQTNKRT